MGVWISPLISIAMFTVGGWQVEQVGPVLGKQRLLREVSTETASGQDHGTILGEILTTLLVHAPDASAFGETSPPY